MSDVDNGGGYAHVGAEVIWEISYIPLNFVALKRSLLKRHIKNAYIYIHISFLLINVKGSISLVYSGV